MKNFGRNCIIAFLMVLAIYQTGELWFGDFSDHNFFFFNDDRNAIYSKNVDYTLDRLIINLGENKVICKGESLKDYTDVFDEGIILALSKGAVVENKNVLDWESILQNRAIIYEYDFLIDGKDLKEIFGVSGDNYASIPKYDKIIISPRVDSSFMRVIFLNSKENTSVFVEIKSNNVIGKIYEACSSFSESEEDIYYISSVENGFDVFKGNIFLPQSKGDIYSYNVIEPHYISNMIEENANLFFENAVIKNYSKNNDNYSFSDETTVVKLYENNVFEYFNYNVKSKKENSFLENYNTAINIIKRDRFVTNEIYLCDYKVEDGKYKFYFNYKINNLPIIPSSEIKESTGMSSFIEVVTSNGSVDNYKKYGCRYTISEKNVLEAKVDFISAIDKVYEGIDQRERKERVIDDMKLVYVASERSFGLKWIFEINGNTFVIDTEGRWFFGMVKC